MESRSPRILHVLRETIEQAENTPGLGPGDPGVVQLQQILTRWTAERDAESAGELGVAGDGSARTDLLREK